MKYYRQKKIAPEAATPETKSSNKNITDNSIPENDGKIKIVVQNPGELSRIVTVINTLEALEELVQGDIQTVTLANGLILVMDVEGRLKGKPKNVHTRLYGDIVGTVFITRAEGESFVSLTPEQCQNARAWLLRHSV